MTIQIEVTITASTYRAFDGVNAEEIVDACPGWSHSVNGAVLTMWSGDGTAELHQITVGHRVAVTADGPVFLPPIGGGA